MTVNVCVLQKDTKVEVVKVPSTQSLDSARHTGDVVDTTSLQKQTTATGAEVMMVDQVFTNVPLLCMDKGVRACCFLGDLCQSIAPGEQAEFRSFQPLDARLIESSETSTVDIISLLFGHVNLLIYDMASIVRSKQRLSQADRCR